MQSTYRLAGHTIRIELLYSQVHTLCEVYRVDDKVEYCITTTPADIAYERKRSARAGVSVYSQKRHRQNHSCPVAELRSSWFRVPQEMDDQKYADRVRFIRCTMWKEPEHTTTYTIFTTTDCNARCFYCYEMGRSRIPMSDETAHKAAAYIAAHCGGEKVHLHWFGGEPLFNKQVIDIICTDLTEKGIVYESMIISNGYLFDGATVEQAVFHWKLKSVQITLDGTSASEVKVNFRFTAIPCLGLQAAKHISVPKKHGASSIKNSSGSAKNWTIAKSEHRTICAKNCVSGNVWRIAAVPLRSCRTGNLGCANITARITLWEALMEKRQSVLSSKVFENTGSRLRRAKPASITPNVSV